MSILVKCRERSVYYLLYYFFLLVGMIIYFFFFNENIVITAIIIFFLYLSYSKSPSTRMIYQIELDDENKTMTIYYYVIYKNKKKMIAFNDLKFELKSTTELVSKKVKYDLIFIKRGWAFGGISNHAWEEPKWSDQDIQFLMRYYYAEIRKT